MPRFVFVKKQVVQAPQYGVEPISLTVGRPQIRSGDTFSNGDSTYRFQLFWNAVTNAVKYKVYRGDDVDGPWTLVVTVNAPTLTYTDSPFNLGDFRIYRVTAVREQSSSSTGSDGRAPPTTYTQTLLYTHEGAMSNYIAFQGVGGFDPPIEAYTTLTTATAQTYGDFIAGGGPASAGFPKPAIVVTINWVAMEGADSIRIYRDGTPIGFASSALSTSYIDDSTALTWGTEYSYQVAGIIGTEEYDKSDPLLVWTIPNAPTALIATAPDDQQQPVSISWTASTGATGYKIYRDGAYLVDSVTNSYSDATTVWGTGYEYQVSATNTGGQGPKSIAAYVTTDPAAPTGLVATAPAAGTEQPIVLTWSAPATGVTTSYNIYRDGVFYANVSSGPYSDVATYFGSTYTYTVKGVNQIGEEGPPSSSSSAAPVGSYMLDAATISTATKNAAIAGYSTRRLRAAYVGPTLELRRSDGTITDFYADAAGNLNTAYNRSGTPFATWISGYTATVQKMYDQSGLGRDLARSTLARQPAYSGGRVVFNYANTTSLQVPYTAAFNTSPFTVSFSCLFTSAPSPADFMSPLSSRGTPGGYMFYRTSAGAIQHWTVTPGPGQNTLGNFASSANTKYKFAGSYNGTTHIFTSNGTAYSVNSGFLPNTQHPFRVGAGETETEVGTFGWNGWVDDIIVFNSAITDLAAVHALM
eukprot:tig00021144_g19031.t1